MGVVAVAADRAVVEGVVVAAGVGGVAVDKCRLRERRKECRRMDWERSVCRVNTLELLEKNELNMINDILRKDQKILFLIGVGIFPLSEFVGHKLFHECLGLDALYGTIFGFNPYYFPLAPIIFFIISLHPQNLWVAFGSGSFPSV